MARGKQTCKILKEIRRQIAEANDIEFVTSECRYQGDCLGTCPKCEAEVRYLEQQLRARSLSGKTVAFAGISAGMILMSGCSGTSSNQPSEQLLGEPMLPIEQIEAIDSIEEEGEFPIVEESVPDEPAECIRQIETTDSINDDKSSVTEGSAIIIREDLCAISVGGVVDDSPVNPDVNGIYHYVEQQPKFPGGHEEMLRFISEHMEYPEEQLKNGIQGRVVVQFYVDTLGRVCEPDILRSRDSALDREALRIVRLFPDFAPGTISGKAVKAYVSIPVVFKLPAD